MARHPHPEQPATERATHPAKSAATRPPGKPVARPAKNPARTPDSDAAEDRGEPTSRMEPLLIGQESRHRTPLTDLVLELAQASAGLRHSLPAALLTPLADLVRAMNCYYSNLIEGHDTHPVDIERALRNDYSVDARQRSLQLEAKAHIAVQQWIDGDTLTGRTVSVDAIREIHRRFCALLPDDLLRVENPATRQRVKVIPGALRDRDVKVGAHVAISPLAVPRFLQRYATVYGSLGKTESILAAAAAHHRLLWIHPFVDGNGRVARLLSHATLREALDTGSLWSVARGLARSADTYKEHLARCDLTRRNDLDGRGNLSEESLAEFTRYFLATCLDQVSFMESLMRPRELRMRILIWADEEVRLSRLPPKSQRILDAILHRGEVLRADTAAIVDASERSARRVVAALIDIGAITSASTRAPLRLAFPASLASRWMPGLFPEKGA
ncbi:MAG: Fic family protein [Burkholderiales bacterium]|nr:Fic family protein [Burkholderiales bacterium]